MPWIFVVENASNTESCRSGGMPGPESRIDRRIIFLPFRRTATRDTEIRGQRIRAGEKVVLWYGSGNRDEEVFEEPFRFDVLRRPNEHVAFGGPGPHHCIGAHLARREMTVMLLVDLSASQRFGTKNGSKVRLATEVAALCAFSAIKHNDRVGLIMATDQVEKIVPPKKGQKHVMRVVREIIGANPERSGTDLVVALETLMHVTMRRSVAFLISDSSISVSSSMVSVRETFSSA